MPKVELVTDFLCQSGRVEKGVSFEGIRVRDVLSLAEPLDYRCVRFESLDGFYLKVGKEIATSDRSLIVIRMNGSFLTPKRGYPARLFIESLQGPNSLKWLHRIILTK